MLTTNNAVVTVTGYSGPGGDVVIPSSADGLPVVAIGAHAFQDWGSITSVSIPEGVRSIETYAFQGCTNLASVTMPSTLISIGDNGFQNCTALSGIAIPFGVTNIGAAAFLACGSLTSVTIPHSVTAISYDVFSSCGRLADVVIPNSVATIGNSAFGDCYSLTNLTIPNSVTAIGAYAFVRCVSLTGVYFEGNAPTDVSAVAFDSAPSVVVYYHSGTSGWGAVFAGRATMVWAAHALLRLRNPGIVDGKFSFTIPGASNQVVIVEECDSLTTSLWSPCWTNTLNGDDSPFMDSRLANSHMRFYRLRSR